MKFIWINDENYIRGEINCRKACQNKMSIQKKESDAVEVLSIIGLKSLQNIVKFDENWV